MSLYQRLILLALLGTAAGCQPAVSPAAKPTSAEGRAWLMTLPGASRTTLPELQEELARLRLEKGLPEQFPQPGNDNNPREWNDLFPDFTRRHSAGQIETLTPGPDLQWGPAELKRAKEAWPRYAAIREKFAAEIQQRTTLGWTIDTGILSSTSSLEAIQLGAKLEVIHAAYQLAEENPAAGFASAELLFRTAWLLAKEGPMVARLAAVPVRESALRTLVATLNHPLSPPDARPQALALLQAELARWPADADAWRVERTQGLLVYELVRTGHFLSLADGSEVERLREKNILKVTAKTARQQVDTDQQRFLEFSRRLITLCNVPCYERQAELKQLRTELEALRETPKFPLVAGMFLLSDFEAVQQKQAEDLARMRGVLLALQQAMGDASASAIHPCTGAPLVVSVVDDSWLVRPLLSANEAPYRIRKSPQIARNRPPLERR